MDIVEYAEKVVGNKLLEYQKVILRKFAELPEDKWMLILYGRDPWPCSKYQGVGNYKERSNDV